MTHPDHTILCAAPMQGFTEAVWRHAHDSVYADGLRYFSPFLRIDKGVVRSRDLRDITSPLNSPLHLTPQIIFRDTIEFSSLVRAVTEAGFSAIDLNLGCPFPPQCHRGRGAAMIARTDVMSQVAELMRDMPHITFSVKMRLGLRDSDEWHPLIDILNRIPNLSHITVHPRTASQQYSGQLHLTGFAAILHRSAHPVIFNGDITTPQQISDLIQDYPAIAGIMIGRGLLMRPSLIREWRDHTEWDHTRRMQHIIRTHRIILDHNSRTLCGDSQIIAKTRPFWDYLEQEIGRKQWKAIRKATTLPAYLSATQ